MTKGTILRLVLTGATLVAAAPVAAQSLPLGSAVAKPYSTSKTEAILGGSSALAAILAKQNAAPAAPVAAPGRAIAATTVPMPASQALPLHQAAMPVFAPVATDRPDVFGSVALSIDRTPLDRRWQVVSRGSAGASANHYAASVGSMDALARIDAINRYVNARVQYVNDIRLSGVEDRWSTGVDTLARGKGDCEDYAIAKLQMLRRAGFADDDLYLVVLRDLRRQADHAVLVVRAEGRLLVLDNGTDRIVDSAVMADYRPIFSFSGTRSWTHGYRRVQPTITYASNEQAAPPSVRDIASLVQAPTVIPAPSAAY